MTNNIIGRFFGDLLSLWDMIRYLARTAVYPLILLAIIVGSWAIFYGLLFAYVLVTY